MALHPSNITVHTLALKKGADLYFSREELPTAQAVRAMLDGAEDFFASGAALMSGVGLNNQFLGTGYNERLHMLGDFGSALYTIKKEK